MDSNAGSNSDRHRSPIRFRLFTLFLLVTGVCLFLSYRATHLVVSAETSIDLRSHILRSIGVEPRYNIDFLGRTRFVDPTDDRIVKQVVADPEVAGLMIIQSQADPALWLMESLEWDIDTDSEKLQLRLLVRRGQQRQAQHIFHAVFRAFLQHAVVDDSVKE